MSGGGPKRRGPHEIFDFVFIVYRLCSKIWVCGSIMLDKKIIKCFHDSFFSTDCRGHRPANPAG